MRWCLLVIVLAVALGFTVAWHAAIAPAKPPHASFNPWLIRRGAQLAAIGNCAACHTTTDASSYSGGLPLRTPFGTVFSTNITPEPNTGIGAWSEAAFRRAMHEGISRDGHLLYPAFPYDHFTRISDDDVKALYGFLMTRDPVNAPARTNQIR